MGHGTKPAPGPFVPTQYNLDEDIGERTNVATEHPEIVKRLQALIDRMDADLGVTDRVPACGSPAASRGIPECASRDSNRPPRRNRPLRLRSALSGRGRRPDGRAPQVGGRAFAIACDVDPRSSDGPIVAHGGASVGYALYLAGGKPAFTVRQKAKTVTITATEAPTGPSVSRPGWPGTER
jgi:cell division ATPase FtsA